MSRRLVLLAILPFALGCTALDLWDAPDVSVETLSCRVDSECDGVHFEVKEALRNDACLVAERSCDRVHQRCIVDLRARDSDHDNFRDIDCAGVRPEFAPFGVDCDDSDAHAYPDADRDGDGFVVAGCSTNGRPEDCDDSRATAYPGATVEACDGVVSTCVDSTPPIPRFAEDFDGDHFAAVDLDPSVCVDVLAENGELLTIPHTDCDDADKLVFPYAPDVCDGRHNDCTSETGVGPDLGEDVDGDGFASPSSLSCDPNLVGGLPNSDCDDLNARTYPGATESCDFIINDCDKRLAGATERAIEDPDRDGRFSGNADCTNSIVNVECVNAAFDRFSAYCLPVGETPVATLLGPVSAMRVGDFNADAIDELVYVRDDTVSPCATSDQITLRYSLNASSPIAQVATICDAPGSTVDAVIADADGDVAPEIITLSAAGTLIAYDVSSVGSMTITTKPAAMGFTVSNAAFAVGRLDGVAQPVIVALEAGSLGYRTLDASAVAGAPIAIDAAAGSINGIVIDDVDGDGIRDVLTYSNASTVISVYPGVSGGTFGAKTTLDAGALLPGIGNVTKVLVGDVEGNGDRDPDLVVASPTALGILARRGGVYVGLPVGIKPSGDALALGAITPRDVVVRDLDADGRAEIVYSDAGRDSVGYIDEIGTSIFAQHVFVADFDGAAQVAAGDYDQDGDQDITMYSPTLNSLVRYTSFFASNPAFSTRVLDRAYDTDVIDSADFDDDGLVDLAALPAIAGGDVVIWRARSRDLTLTDEIVPFRADVGETLTGLATGEMTGDVRPDIVVTAEASGRVGFARGNGDVTFAARQDMPTFDKARAVAIADLDHVGMPEIVVSSNGGSEGRLAIYARPDSQSPFTRTVLATGSAACTDLALGDIDADRDLDIAIACRTGGLTVFINPGTLAATWNAIVVDPGGVADTSSVELVDMDRDGDADVVSYRAEIDSFSIYLAAGGTLAASPTIVSANVFSDSGAQIRSADFDKDGDADLVVTGLDVGSSVRMFQSVGGPRLRFVPTVLRSNGGTTRPSTVSVVDVDKDGDDDLIMSLRVDQDVYLLRSAGTPWWLH